MKDETANVAIKEFVGSKLKMYSLLEEGSSGDKKAEGLIKNVVATISHNEYKDTQWIEFKVKIIE